MCLQVKYWGYSTLLQPSFSYDPVYILVGWIGTLNQFYKDDIDVRYWTPKAKECFWKCKELFRSNINMRLKKRLLQSLA